MSRIDLHAHTIHSDGTLTPTALVRLADEVGLSMLAVTDHDTTSGLEEARDEGRRTGIEVIAGCEVSTRIDAGNVHVLGLGFDPSHAGFQRFLAQVRERRDERNVRMLERLAQVGAPITMEEVRKHAHGRIVARPHIGRALVERGYVRDLREAFTQYLKDGGRAYVEVVAPHPTEAVKAIREAGGAAVLAHPGQIRLTGREAYDAFLRELVAAGLAGMEVWHPSHDSDDRAMFLALATQHGLVPSGGSDFHGETKPHIKLGTGDGTIAMERATWDALGARRRVA